MSLAPNPNRLTKLNCAGQACVDRDLCRRYVVRIAGRTVERDGMRFPLFAWGSFDVEAAVMGSCAAFVRVRE